MSASKSGLRSDLAKVDARGVTSSDYDEIPELGDEFFNNADEHRNGMRVTRGRGRREEGANEPAY